MSKIYHLLIPFIIAFFATLWIHPKILRIAILKNLVDNPDARKLQRNPVPVMGGLAVFFGIVAGLCSSQIAFFSPGVFVLMAAMTIMLYTGTIDDILDLTPRTRFIIEIVVVAFIMLVNNSGINHFWGLWGIDFIPVWIAGPLTIFAAVGIINAINLIDGVNGLSSGFCFMASVMFAIMLYISGNTHMTILAVTAAGAIIPFFLHNVFGNTTKMFIGDGGTLVIGTMMSMFVVSILKGSSLSANLANDGMGLIPFTLAVLAVPVFDTLRVMSTRILKKQSPFHPDKTHLHHMFIELGFSHIGTTVSILTLNFLIILTWFVSYKLGASVDTQLYIVLALSFLITFVFYKFAQVQIKNNTKALKFLQRIASMLQIEKKGIWAWAQRLIDKL
ncbi:MAG: undecaprenyl/decaprenyl-phosphate alpha-N-acetylglucosaminyl 1-phosphate transferase [Bacteroidaceae bacterium]|nr:undecaprenyl/decaprenyl-phosphate alpha-N-acetylglucosaminyl 1-phosphate transferase [Bacteroidaceae bacterium]MBR3612172.1 undecaprenyl/decaprenyl-phosphate alpha-N-acetylglucosaminyl 1-phosphate transferase [Bacteroidaceae bacterium]